MTIEEADRGVKRLKASYPTMKPLDELTTAAYMEGIGDLAWDDFATAAKAIVRSSTFFPSIAELREAANVAAQARFQARDREEREERLAIQAGEDKIMDPKSAIHREPVGPNHRIFLEYLNGTRTFPEPEWVKRSKLRQPAAEIQK